MIKTTRELGMGISALFSEPDLLERLTILPLTVVYTFYNGAMP